MTKGIVVVLVLTHFTLVFCATYLSDGIKDYCFTKAEDGSGEYDFT